MPEFPPSSERSVENLSYLAALEERDPNISKLQGLSPESILAHENYPRLARAIEEKLGVRLAKYSPDVARGSRASLF